MIPWGIVTSTHGGLLACLLALFIDMITSPLLDIRPSSFNTTIRPSTLSLSRANHAWWNQALAFLLRVLSHPHLGRLLKARSVVLELLGDSRLYCIVGLWRREHCPYQLEDV